MHIMHNNTYEYPSGTAWAEWLIFLLAILGIDDHGLLGGDQD